MALFKRPGRDFYYTRFTINGVRIDKSTKEISKFAAKKFEEKLMQDVKAELVYGVKPKHSWEDAIDRWIHEMRHKRSIKQDAQTAKFIITEFTKIKFEDTTKQQIENLATIRESKNVTPSTVNRTLALIKSVLNRAYKHWGWIDKVPYVALRKENIGRIRWLTKDESVTLLSQLPGHLRLMAEFTLATGLRASNVQYLKWTDIDFKQARLTVSADSFKSGINHSLPLNKIALDILQGALGKHKTYVFTYKNKPVSQCSTKAWRNALLRAGIKNFRWHDLRHTWASWHIQNGTSLQELQRLGGWASFNMVLRYAHLSVDNLKDAANRLVGIK